MLEQIDRALALAPDHAGARAQRQELLARHATSLLAEVPAAEKLQARWRLRLETTRAGAPERPEPLADRRRREQHLALCLAAQVWLDRGKAGQRASDALLVLHRQSALRLGWLALLGREYTLVRQAAGSLTARGAAEQARALDDAARSDRQARLSHWLKRVDTAVSETHADLGRSDRPAGAPLWQDYLIELSASATPGWSLA